MMQTNSMKKPTGVSGLIYLKFEIEKLIFDLGNLQINC